MKVRIFLCLLTLPLLVHAQNAVNVTITAADTTLAIGETTTVTVWAQVASPQDGDSAKIFSWYVDVLTNPDDASVVNTNWNSLLMPESDSPDGSATTAGAGTTDANNNRRGIYNTFLNPTTSQSGIANPGVGSPVVLMTFDVTATGAGTHTYTVAAGTTQILTNDFQVLRTGGAGLYTGGNYSAASLTLTVEAPPEPDLEAINFRISDVSGGNVTLSFNPQAGFDHTVQSSQTLQVGSWSDLPGGPHNSGTVVDNLGVADARFYRLIVLPSAP